MAKDSACAAILREAEEITKNANPEVRADFEECKAYWTEDYPALAEETRSSIILGFTVLMGLLSLPRIIAMSPMAKNV